MERIGTDDARHGDREWLVVHVRTKADGQLSVEEGIAKTLGIHLGDTLTYDVAGTRFSAKVVNLRKVQWDSMQVNFFVIAAPGLLEDFPASYITSFYLPPDQGAVGECADQGISPTCC